MDVVVGAGLQAVIVIVVQLASKEEVVEAVVVAVAEGEVHFHGVKDQVLERVARKRHQQ